MTNYVPGSSYPLAFPSPHDNGVFVSSTFIQWICWLFSPSALPIRISPNIRPRWCRGVTLYVNIMSELNIHCFLRISPEISPFSRPTATRYEGQCAQILRFAQDLRLVDWSIFLLINLVIIWYFLCSTLARNDGQCVWTLHFDQDLRTDWSIFSDQSNNDGIFFLIYFIVYSFHLIWKCLFSINWGVPASPLLILYF